MYALVNTFNKIPGSSIGTIMSKHRLINACFKARSKVSKYYGNGAYLPTEIVWVEKNFKTGYHLGNGEFEMVNIDYLY